MSTDSQRSTICLNMIVKNERHVIQRCFDSLKQAIDYWVISDTGSTDGTQAFIKSYFAEQQIPGELHEHAWQDFAHNRNCALKAAYNKADYILFMDADDYITWHSDNNFGVLVQDAYLAPMQSAGGTLYYNIKLINSTQPWEWRGVLHESICYDSHYSSETLSPNLFIIASTREGARNNDPHKYLKDAQVLEAAIAKDGDNSRYQFYLGRSYYDAESYAKALSAYQKRVNMGGWEEEVYYSLLEIARCKSHLNHPLAEVIEAYVKSYLYRPTRLEGLCSALRLCRTHGLYSLGYELGRMHTRLVLPDDVLFVDSSVYHWRFLDEFAICAIHSGRAKEVLAMLAHLIASPTTPAEQLERLKANLNFAIGF